MISINFNLGILPSETINFRFCRTSMPDFRFGFSKAEPRTACQEGWSQVAIFDFLKPLFMYFN